MVLVLRVVVDDGHRREIVGQEVVEVEGRLLRAQRENFLAEIEMLVMDEIGIQADFGAGFDMGGMGV